MPCWAGLCRTVEEVNLEATVLGLSIAAASVVASGMQQILVRTLQQVRGRDAGPVLPAGASSRSMRACEAALCACARSVVTLSLLPAALTRRCTT